MNPRDVTQVLLSTGSGRVGAVFLTTLVLVSLFVLIRFPLDFGPTRWNNPASWADNPKAAAPAWTRLWQGNQAIGHRVYQSQEPSASTPLADLEQRTYTFSYDYGGGRAPTLMALSVVDVRFASRPTVLTLQVRRPDGRTLTLYQTVVRGPREGETPPYLRFQDAPLRVNLSSDGDAAARVREFYAQQMGVALTVEALQGRITHAVFGTPIEGAPGQFQPLPGAYQFTLTAVTGASSDVIGNVKLVMGGSVYGVMGTDTLGRDLALGLLFGFPVALTIGIATSVFATIIGASLGMLSGYMAGKTDLVIQRFTDIWSNVPLLPILIFLIFILGQKLWLVVVLMILFGWPGLTIVVRSMVLQLRSGQLVEATQALGASKVRIMFRHLLFQIAPFIFAQMIFFTPGAILAEASLSFLGLGDPSIPTWGQILENGFRTGAVYVGYWWWVLPPGLLIVVTAMTFVLLTLGLEPVVNPRLRENR
ncbi:MAG: ABC transporter permease [Chloroflexi bacterium]|nr:ABC transporter permease [Chloroflexota bacterium]